MESGEQVTLTTWRNQWIPDWSCEPLAYESMGVAITGRFVIEL